MARKDSASLDLTNHHRGPHETGGSSGGPPGSRSAFRAVHQGESFLAPTSEGSYMSWSTIDRPSLACMFCFPYVGHVLIL